MSIPTPEALKTYDVPDPAPQPKYFLRTLFATAVGLVVALSLLAMVRLPHLAYVATHMTDRYDEITPNYVAERCADEMLHYPPEELTPYVLAMEDPFLRGKFHETLALTKDSKQIDAILTNLRGEYGVEQRLKVILPSLKALGKAESARAIVAAHEDEEARWKDPDHQEALRAALHTEFEPADYIDRILAIEDPVRRGRFHAALATTKDSKQVDAVLAFARTIVPASPGASRGPDWDPLVKSLGEFGPAATPKLEAALLQTDSRSLVSLAAEALRTSDLPYLLRRTMERLDEYDQSVPQLARAASIVRAVDDQEELDVTPEQVAAAREVVAAATARGYMIFEMLRALDALTGEQVDFCVVRGLSTFDRDIAEWSAMRIKERLSPEKLVDTLFSYIAQKQEFDVSEVETYEGLMRELGAEGATRVAWNLERLIGEAGGDPDQVFWIYKKMGCTLLGELGGPGAIPTLRKYLTDEGGYTLTTTETVNGQKKRKEVQIRYAALAKKAIGDIELRASGGGEPPGTTTGSEGE